MSGLVNIPEFHRLRVTGFCILQLSTEKAAVYLRIQFAVTSLLIKCDCGFVDVSS